MKVTERPAGPGLKSADERLRPTLETLPAAAYTCDSEGLITYFNRHAVKLWGREPKLNDLADRYCGSFRLFSTDGSPIPHDECWMALALRNRQAYTGSEILIERPDGSRWVALAHANPFLNESGEVAGAVSILVDITDRRNAELVHSQLAAVVNSSDDAIISKDLNGVIQSWNAAAQRLFGYTAEQVVGRHISILIPDERANEEERILARLRAGERIHHFDTVRLRRDGQPIHVSLTVSPVRDGTGRIVGASKIARDITDRKEAEERIYALLAQLKDADSRKDEFLATLAHELRNGLAPLNNALQIMGLAGRSAEPVEQSRILMERQLGHLARLVDDLLDVARISKGKLQLLKERVELTAAVTNAVDAGRPLIEGMGHELTVTLPPVPIYLDGDPVRLTQVFLNLLNNAAKYTNRGGRIWLTMERQGSDAVVSVKDSGIGIAAGQLSRIFEMFAQVDASVEKAQGGLGLGLALVKMLVEMHGGTIEARSEGLGQGSEFVVRLPVVLDTTGGPLPPSVKATATCCRILVVDDNRDSAESLGTLLEIVGNTVKMAHDGIEAVNAAEAFRPDVVLLDLGLPKLNGYDVCLRIRGEPWGRSMFLVALTGWGQDEDRRRSREAGFDAHLVKPVDFTTLTKLLAEVKS